MLLIRNSFQSLKGISAFWNLESYRFSLCQTVSIPQKDISILEPTPVTTRSPVTVFQSLKGISAFWNLALESKNKDLPRFNPSKGYQHFGTSLAFTSSAWQSVSIPQRDISILEPQACQSRYQILLFQSLKGISAFWNE